MVFHDSFHSGVYFSVARSPEEEKGFTSIPRSVYWAVVTLTTVGYGDISLKSGAGQFLAAIVMILGYSIIAVPTGIVTVELSRAYMEKSSYQACPNCSAEGHDRDAVAEKNFEGCGGLEITDEITTS